MSERPQPSRRSVPKPSTQKDAVTVPYSMARRRVWGWMFSTEPIRPKLSKLDPLKGTKKLFDKRNSVKSAVNTLKLAVALGVTVIVIAANLSEIIGLPMLEAAPGAAALLGLLLELALWLLSLLMSGSI